MLGIIRKILYSSDRETIKIFERVTKIDYEPDIFDSLKVLSISYTDMESLNPFSVFHNLEILNLSNNRISDIEPLKNLSSLKIIDLRLIG